MTDQRTDEYQGHTNRETWAAGLWLSNVQAMYEYATDAAVRAYVAGHAHARGIGLDTDENTGSGWYEDELGDLRDVAERLLTDPRDGTPDSMLGDIGSLWRVDFRDLFRTMLPEDADELAERAHRMGLQLPDED